VKIQDASEELLVLSEIASASAIFWNLSAINPHKLSLPQSIKISGD
jgi:hypothetical protein